MIYKPNFGGSVNIKKEKTVSQKKNWAFDKS